VGPTQKQLRSVNLFTASQDRAYTRIILNSPYDGGTSKRSGGLNLDKSWQDYEVLY
jgi:hypothetical protein